MSDNSRETNRREFLKRCAGGALAMAAAPEIAKLPLAAADTVRRTAPPAVKSRVVVAHDLLLRNNGSTVDSKRMLALLDRAMQSFYGLDRADEAWKRLVRPGEKVGLKVNTIAGRGLSTNVVFVEAICERLQQAGIKAQDIIVWDREDHELERAGFRLSTAANRVVYRGTNSVGYEEQPVSFGSVQTKLSKILTRQCDLFINAPILKDHCDAGITAAMKNMYGVIDNPFRLHARSCAQVADLNMIPAIRSKMRLTICDATTACYDGGPEYTPDAVWSPNSVLIGRDPVALDTIAWQIIERKRKERRIKSLEEEHRAPRYIALAAKQQLGTDDPKRIESIEV